MTRDPFYRRESPSGVRYHDHPSRRDPSLTEKGHMFVPEAVEDEYRAMMEDRPWLGVGGEDHNPHLWERVSELLNESEMAVIEMTVIQGLTLRETGELLAQERGRDRPYGKAWMQAVRDNALLKLRKEFLGNDDA